MSDPDRFQAAVAAQVLAAAGHRRELLQSIVEVARAIFLAQASSIAVLDERAGDFVFEAVAGQGSERLVGARFPAGQGIAGTVAQTADPVIIDDLSNDPNFARDVAKNTGYVPQAMMVAPLLCEERILGVLSVLDRGITGRGTLEELELLVHFAGQAALAIDLGEAARRAAALLQGGEEDLARAAALVRRVEGLGDERREVGLRLLAALEELLSR